MNSVIITIIIIINHDHGSLYPASIALAFLSGMESTKYLKRELPISLLSTWK